MQTVSTAYSNLSANPSKAVDFAFVIAGWPTVYTVASDTYTIPSSGGDITTGKGFTTLRKWANAPTGAAMKCKARPEEGKNTTGQMDVTIQDRTDAGVRAISDMLSRQAYLEGTSSGVITQLDGDLAADTVDIDLDDTTGLSAGDAIFIGQECIKVGTVASGTSLTGCTRGWRLTSPTPHDDNVKVYNFKPSLYRSKAYIFKGYQGLALADWVPAFGGFITGHSKQPGAVTFAVHSTDWETFQARRRVILSEPPFDAGDLVNPNLPLDFNVSVTFNVAVAAAFVPSVHFGYVLNVGGMLWPITGAT